jgi:hypothetical protein
MNPMESRKEFIFAYQALGAYFRPYKDFFNLKMREEF